jgi:hypothetical protein
VIKKVVSGAKMDTVKLTLYSWVARTLGNEKDTEITLELPLPAQKTVKGLMDEMAKRYPIFARDIYNIKTAKINPEIILVVNGNSISRDQMRTPLKKGDLLSLVTLTDGG